MQAKADRASLHSQLAQKDSELAELPGAPNEQWPAPVAELVAAQVGSAVATALSEAQANSATSDAQQRQASADAAAQSTAAQAHIAKLESQLAAAQAQLQRAQDEAAAQVAALQERLREATATLQAADPHGEGPPADTHALQAQVQEQQQLAATAVAELAQVRAELDTLRAQTVHELWERERLAGGNAEALDESVGGASASRTAASVASASDAAAAAGPPLATEGSAAAAQEAVEYWRRCYEDAQGRVAALERDVAASQRELRDERHAHELRSLADAARRNEIAELQARQARGSVDVEYLKNCLIGFFESGALPAHEQVVSVLARLLHFTEHDRARMAGPARRNGAAPRTPVRQKSAARGFSIF